MDVSVYPLQLHVDTNFSRNLTMKLSQKFCKCVKSVRKTVKARPGFTKEQAAIAICTKSILFPRGRTMKKFKCGPKNRLVTQKRRT
jgi:hypothetical protein